MRRIGQRSDPETAAHSLLLVPLWHLLSRTLQKPFEMNTYEQIRHNNEKPVWWGLSTVRIQWLLDKDLKPILAKVANDNR